MKTKAMIIYASVTPDQEKNKTEKEEETVVKSVNTDFDKIENFRVVSLWGKHI